MPDPPLQSPTEPLLAVRNALRDEFADIPLPVLVRRAAGAGTSQLPVWSEGDELPVLVVAAAEGEVVTTLTHVHTRVETRVLVTHVFAHTPGEIDDPDPDPDAVREVRRRVRELLHRKRPGNLVGWLDTLVVPKAAYRLSPSGRAVFSQVEVLVTVVVTAEG